MASTETELENQKADAASEYCSAILALKPRPPSSIALTFALARLAARFIPASHYYSLTTQGSGTRGASWDRRSCLFSCAGGKGVEQDERDGPTWNLRESFSSTLTFPCALLSVHPPARSVWRHLVILDLSNLWLLPYPGDVCSEFSYFEDIHMLYRVGTDG
jgi:hypothetical protein